MSEAAVVWLVAFLFVGLAACYAVYMKQVISEARDRAHRASARQMRAAAVDLVRRYEDSATPNYKTMYSTLADRLAELPLDNATTTWRRM